MNTEHLEDRPRREGLSSPLDHPASEREKRYRTLFGAMDEGFCVVEMVFDEAGRSIDYRFLEFNAAFERMTGISAGAALAGKSARQLYPALEEHWFETYGRVATTGESTRFENEAKAMGKWFEVHAFRIGDASSHEVGILFKDVTERRRAEIEQARRFAESQTSRAFLDLITDQLPVRVGYIGPDMRYRYLNRTYERTFGLGADEGVGKSVQELAGEDAFRKAEPHLRRALAGETNFQSFWVEYAFGRRRIEANYIADPSEGGVVVHVADVTERFEIEARLNDARARRDRALENAEVATFDWDVVNDRVYANGLLADFFGISGDDAHGGSIARYFEAVYPEDRALVQSTIVESLATGGRYEAEYRVLGFEGRQRSVLARGDASLDREGKPLRLSGVITDVSALKESEERYRTLFNSLEEGFCVLEMIFDEVGKPVDYRFREVNEAFETLTGLQTLGVFEGKTMRDIFPTHEQAWFDRYARVAKTGEPLFVEDRAEGLGRWYEIHAFRIGGEGSVEVGALFKDVTERRRVDQERERLLAAEIEARQAIIEREELFRTVFEQAPDDAILVMDAHRTITAWNPAAERICGWTVEEAMGQPADMIFTLEDRAQGLPSLETSTAARIGKAEDERWHLRKDGTRFWGSGTMNALHTDDGVVRGYLKVFRDTTERYQETQTLAFLSLLTEAVIDQREADEILDTAERMVGQYIGASRVAFAEVALDGDSVTIRREWAPDQVSLVGSHRLDDFGAAVGAKLRAGQAHVSRDAVAESGSGSGSEAVQRFGIGSGISVPVMTEGRLTSIIVVHAGEPRDWTGDEIGLVRQVADRMSAEIERARAETALRTSEARFRQLVDLSPSTVWFGEIDGGLSYISQDFFDMTGLTPETALPHGWATTVHPEDLARVAEHWEAARRNEMPYDTEFRIRHRDGIYRWISARALPVRDAAGTVSGWLGSNNDIHERKTAEATLQARVDERTQELQAAVREAEGFNYSISHDLRTPLRAIASTSSILLEEAAEDLDEDHRALLVRQVENASRLGRLIDELLRLSRLSRVEVNRQSLDMSAKATSVFEELNQHDETNGCQIEVQPGMAAQGDPGLVRTVFENLLGNACKFSPNGGIIRVGQEFGTFFVADGGVGFDMRFAPKIFLPFERLVTDAEFPGTGIGLANVERIVRRHGGRVWVESEPGRGTTFRFTLG